MSGIIGLNFVAARTVGASEVKGVAVAPTASGSRATVYTPTSGKKVRIIGVSASWPSDTFCRIEFYFGTGAEALSNAGKLIWNTGLDQQVQIGASTSYPDGGGPVGAVDDVVSIIRDSAATTGFFTVIFREE